MDAGLLFWRSHEPPDEEEDIFEGEEYSDLGIQLNVIGYRFKKIYMNSTNTLSIKFSNGGKLVLQNNADDETRIVEECVK